MRGAGPAVPAAAALLAAVTVGCMGTGGSAGAPPASSNASASATTITSPSAPPASPAPAASADPAPAPVGTTSPATGGTAPPERAVEPAGGAVGGAVTVPAALALARGSQVRVAGTYSAMRGACSGVPPSRSAWHLSASGDPGAPCIYVDGPLPRGANALTSAGAGSPVVVTGVIDEQARQKYVVGQKVEAP